MEKATDIILVICGTLLCVGGMFSVGDTFRSATGIVLGLALVVLGLVDKDRPGPSARAKGSTARKAGKSDLQELSFEREALGLPISVTLSGSGNDTLVKIRGGSAPEIGSVSVAYCDGGEPVLRTLLRPGSRDDVVSDMFAERLSRKLGSTVTAVCCIRCTAGGEGDSAVLECTRELLDDVLGACG